MKPNPEKCHLLIKRKKINIGSNIIGNSKCEKLLEFKFDNKLNVEAHVGDFCKKACCKIHALARITPCMSLFYKIILLNAFFKSQFSYSSLAWMCHSRTLHNKINTLYERCLRVIYYDKHSKFQELLHKDKSISTYTRNLQTLVTEIFKVTIGIAPDILANIFNTRNKVNYNLHHFFKLYYAFGEFYL